MPCSWPAPGADTLCLGRAPGADTLVAAGVPSASLVLAAPISKLGLFLAAHCSPRAGICTQTPAFFSPGLSPILHPVAPDLKAPK